MMSLFYAYCWRSGLIEFGPVLPDGALELASSDLHDKQVMIDRVSVRARHGWDNSLLVPGVPEAATDEEAISALLDWRSWGGLGGRIEWQGSTENFFKGE